MRLRFGRVASTTSISGKKEIETRSTSKGIIPMQFSTMTMLLVVAYFAVVGFLMTWAASNSQSYRMHRIHLAIARVGHFAAFYLASLLPFLNGTLQPVVGNQPVVVIGLVGGMIFAYYAPRLQLGWHERRRSTKS